MALITKVKAGSVSSLSDARYFAGMGVDWLGFDVDSSSPHYVSPELYKNIIGWVTGPLRVLELPLLDSVAIQSLIETYVPDVIEVDSRTLEAAKRVTTLPIILRVNLDDTLPAWDTFALAKYVSIVTVSPLSHKATIEKISKVTDVLLTVSPDQHQLKELLTLLPIAGVCLQGSPEIQVGLKDYSFADLLESLDLD